MKILVQYFARHRDVTGRDDQVVDLPDGASVSALAARLGQEYPGLSPLLRISRAAVNEEYTTGDQVLQESDRVAFIPPVSGG